MTRYLARALYNPAEKKECNLSVAYGVDHTPMGLFLQIYSGLIDKETGNEILFVDKDQMFSKPPLTVEEFLKLVDEWKIDVSDIEKKMLRQGTFY